MAFRRIHSVLLLAASLVLWAATSHAQAQRVGPPPVANCSFAQGVDSRVCIIDGQIRNLEGQLRVARAAGVRGVSQPRNMAASIRSLEEQLRALKARRALLVAGLSRGVRVAEEEDDDDGFLFLLPLLGLALLMGAGGGSSGPGGTGGERPPTVYPDGYVGAEGPPDVGGESVSPS